MNKEIKILEIITVGTNSVLGGIVSQEKNPVECNDYCWVIMARLESFDAVKQQCEELGIKDYLLVDRHRTVLGQRKCVHELSPRFEN